MRNASPPSWSPNNINFKHNTPMVDTRRTSGGQVSEVTRRMYMCQFPTMNLDDTNHVTYFIQWTLVEDGSRLLSCTNHAAWNLHPMFGYRGHTCLSIIYVSSYHGVHLNAHWERAWAFLLQREAKAAYVEIGIMKGWKRKTPPNFTIPGNLSPINLDTSVIT